MTNEKSKLEMAFSRKPYSIRGCTILYNGLDLFSVSQFELAEKFTGALNGAYGEGRLSELLNPEVPKKSVDAIVEVTIWFFRKGQKVQEREVENLYSLGKPSWDEVSIGIPESQRGPKDDVSQLINIEQRLDTEFTQDWYGFEFIDVGEGKLDWKSGVSNYRQEVGDETTFEDFHDDLMKLAPKFGDKPCVRFLTAWSYWSMVDFDGEYSDGIKLLGRLDLNNMNLLEIES